MACSIWAASRMLTGLTTTPMDAAMDWISVSWPAPVGMLASRRTATRIASGAISLSSSSHFPLKLYSNCIKPVTLPPGRDRLPTKPAATGSTTLTNTIGIVRVACNSGGMPALPLDKMTSGASATSSPACLRMRSASPVPQRVSIRKVAVIGPAQLLQPLHERCKMRLRFRIRIGLVHERADAPNAVRPLGARCDRPSHRTTHENRKLPPSHASLHLGHQEKTDL